jgi:hypothetical protein
LLGIVQLAESSGLIDLQSAENGQIKMAATDETERDGAIECAGPGERHLRQHPAQSVAAGANALDECALRHELDLQLTRHHLSLRFGVEADVAHNGLAEELGPDELANPLVQGRGVVGNDGQIMPVLADDLINDGFGRAHAQEPANHQACTMGDHPHRLIERNRLHLDVSSPE